MNKGFTLIELSIVLVIIALIVAGIMGGRELVRAAEVQSVIADINGFKTAINSFQMQYDAMPGDMNNAFAYWGTNCGVAPANCNGTGDNQVDWLSYSPVSESLRFWQHLSLAEITPGSFAGAAAGMPFDVLDTTVPSSQLDGTGFSVQYFCGPACMASFSDTIPASPVFGRNGNRIIFGSYSSMSGKIGEAALSARDAKALDSKIDDGVAVEGKVTTGQHFGATMAAAPYCLDDPLTGALGDFMGTVYNLQEQRTACQMQFWLDG